MKNVEFCLCFFLRSRLQLLEWGRFSDSYREKESLVYFVQFLCIFECCVQVFFYWKICFFLFFIKIFIKFLLLVSIKCTQKSKETLESLFQKCPSIFTWFPPLSLCSCSLLQEFLSDRRGIWFIYWDWISENWW